MIEPIEELYTLRKILNESKSVHIGIGVPKQVLDKQVNGKWGAGRGQRGRPQATEYREDFETVVEAYVWATEFDKK